jgi:hypothetical protein
MVCGLLHTLQQHACHYNLATQWLPLSHGQLMDVEIVQIVDCKTNHSQDKVFQCINSIQGGLVFT